MNRTSLFKIPLLILAAMAMTACVSTRVESTTNDFVAKKDTKILLLEPDVQLSLITTGGVRETRADWSETAQKNVLNQMQTALSGNGHELISYDPDTASAKEIQLVKLHEAVGSTILRHEYGQQKLPSKRGVFDYTLGDGVKELKDKYDADYAMFLYARGGYASAGRQVLATAVLIATYGGNIGGTGDQQAFASLIDLETGDVVWFNVTVTGRGTDIRKPEGSERMVKALLKKIPI